MANDSEAHGHSPPVDTPIESKAGTVPTAEDRSGTVDQESHLLSGEVSDPTTTTNIESGDIERSKPIPTNAEFLSTVSTFVKKLEPWKGIMPTSLLYELEDLEAFSQMVLNEVDAGDPKKWTCEIERGSMEDWRKLDYNQKKTPKPVIQAFYLQKPGSSAATHSSETNEPEARKPEPLGPDAIGDHKNLQRIQINSDLLLTEIESITSLSTSVLVAPAIIAPPYKYLLRFLPGIKSRLGELEDDLRLLKMKSEGDDAQVSAVRERTQVGTLSEGSENNASNTSKSRDELPTTDSNLEHGKQLLIRYSHLECLYNFIQDELQDVLNIRAKIANGTLERIQFEDLWHLFEPGDIIYSTDHGRDQLYKVYSITGGQIQRRNRNAEEISELANIKDKLQRWIDPWEQEDEEEETIDKLLREEVSGKGTWTPLKVDCYMMAFDGEYCGPVEVCKQIRHYVGEREISSLPMYPLRFHPASCELLRKMQDRGERYLYSSGHKSYDGKTLALKRHESRQEIESDIYIDFDAFYQDHPRDKPKIGTLLRSRPNYSEVQEEVVPGSGALLYLTGHEVDLKIADDFMASNRMRLERFKPGQKKESNECLALMPHQVVGYAFRLRKWFHLDIDLVQDIDKSSADPKASGFDDLVIPERYRKLLVALVDNHASGLQRAERKAKHASTAPVTTQLDLVRGKGQGLIILLHGPPGSGKTSTAETIAAYTHRPLYSITCGDVGLTPDVVEASLLDHTRRADKWGCVLLLDEADVFLMQRNWQDLKRNALVSVFLRQLEYYSGILFLTTNRPGTLDEAFKSRIHVSLRYPSIDLESTKKMWTNIMNRLEHDNKTADVKVIFDRDALLDFAQRHFEKHEKERQAWNGRQIRNAFQTALAIGHYDRLKNIRDNNMTPEEALATGKKKWKTVKLTKANLQTIAKTAREFEEYIEQLRGKDTVNARESELRYDEYDPDRPRARKQYSPASSSRYGVSPAHKPASMRAHGPKHKISVQGKHRSTDEEDEDELNSGEISPDDDDDDDDKSL